jgi:hypothetical protein
MTTADYEITAVATVSRVRRARRWQVDAITGLKNLAGE